MFILGHLGIGERLARPFAAPGTRRWIYLGALLPDLIDKPLYYGLSLATGRHAAALGLISSSRTVGHTLLFLLLVRLLAPRLLAARLFAAPLGAARLQAPLGAARLQAPTAAAHALALGMATHLLLDELGDLWGLVASLAGGAPDPLASLGPPTLAAILFPLLGWHFPVMPFSTATEHLRSLVTGWTLAAELLGASLIAWDLWSRRQSYRSISPK